MAKAAERAAGRALLKVKLGAAGDPERIAAVRAAAPRATLIVDANEGWDEANLDANLAACADAGVALVEQPLPAGRDAPARAHRPPHSDLRRRKRPRPRLAGALAGKYDAVNIKLDKAGGLTEALAMAQASAQAKSYHHGRLHGGDLARRWRRRCCWRKPRNSSISTARCCWKRTARTA